MVCCSHKVTLCIEIREQGFLAAASCPKSCIMHGDLPCPATTPGNLLLAPCTYPQQSVRSGCAASLPSAKLVFSHAMLVTPRDGVPTLIARVCNTRGNYLLNPEVCALATLDFGSQPARMLTCVADIAC